MYSQMKLVTTLILVLNCLNKLNCTRIPMEIVQLTSTQVTHNDDDNDNSTNLEQHKMDLVAAAAATVATIPTQNSNKNNFEYHTVVTESRRGRQLTDTNAVHLPRILYQVGMSENDLPFCATNAVCSKIDLYETPWIERQCRCPKQSYSKHLHTIYHAKEVKSNTNYRHMLEQKFKFDDTDDNDNYQRENEHMKNLLHKLGAIYNKDDILTNDNDFSNDDLNIAPLHQSVKNKKRFDDNSNSLMQNIGSGNTKFRHSGHRDIPRIGGCPSAISDNDEHTIADKTRLYKLCEPVHKLPVCRYFRDYTWTLKSSPEMNITEQIVHCRCPKNSVSYLIKREPLKMGTLGYTYLFACSPQSRLKCQRKEPCKLFTVRKRQELLDEVNTNPLCQCPRNHRCPRLHTDSGVILGKSYIEDNIRTYSGYCMPDI